MPEQQQNPTGYRIGDKVHVRSGESAGARGVILREEDGLIEVGLTNGGVVLLQPGEVTNYSLAARRAWHVMPKRAGRPRSATARKKMVSMRMDVDLWEMLARAVEAGQIDSKEQAINQWVRYNLEQMQAEQNADS